MPTWGEILRELDQLVTLQQNANIPFSPFDVVRRRHLAALAQHTGRNTILYATRWTQGGGDPQAVSLTPEDLQGFMEVVNGLTGPSLDVVLHSPGGSAEATDAIVKYLRSKFSDIRVIVPHAAMSAATMFACAANRIVMGRHSFLGPIDPQLILATEHGPTSVPAYAIQEQFKEARDEVKKDPTLLPAWLPILRQYGPALIVQCRLMQQLAITLVSDWLARYMFAGDPAATQKGADVAAHLSDHSRFMSHSRFIDREHVRGLGLRVDDLEANQHEQDAALSVFHCATHTFSGTGAAKIIENHQGKAFIKQQQIVRLPPNQLGPKVPLPGVGPQPPPLPAP